MSNASLSRSFAQKHTQEGPKIYCQRNEWTELIMALLSQPGKGSQGLRRFRPALMNFNGHISTLSGNEKADISMQYSPG